MNGNPFTGCWSLITDSLLSAVTIDKARELLAVQADFGGFYNRNSARLILAEVQKEHGQAAVDQLIEELHLDAVFEFKTGESFGD